MEAILQRRIGRHIHPGRKGAEFPPLVRDRAQLVPLALRQVGRQTRIDAYHPGDVVRPQPAKIGPLGVTAQQVAFEVVVTRFVHGLAAQHVLDPGVVKCVIVHDPAKSRRLAFARAGIRPKGY